MRRIRPIVIGAAILALVGAAVLLGLKAAYGGFGDYYDVSVTMPRTGQQLELGSEVRLRGVIIGSVNRIELVDRKVQLTLQIERKYKIPADSEAVVSLTTLLGAKFIDLKTSRFAGPFLADGGVIREGRVGPELEDALADGVEVLDAIRPDDLATVVENLVQGARGHGEDIARNLNANANLSRLFATTLDPQLRSLHDFRVVFGALRNSGVDLNNLADALNQGVPVYASAKAQAELDRALRAVTPFANNLGDLFILNRADWDRLMDAGDTVLQTIAVRPGGLRDLVHGLYRYVYKLSGDPCTKDCGLDDGSGAAGFTNFIGGSNSEQNREEICGALPPELRDQVPLCNGTIPGP
jgi:virulence factor Mce-like protein